MLKQQIKQSLRSIKKQKGYIAINIIGLALGLACSILISIYVIHELSYDRFNAKKDSIYKLTLSGKIGSQELNVAYSSAPIGPAMHNDFPEVESFCRVHTMDVTNIKYNNNSFEERNFIEADSSFFDFFSIPLIHGNPNDVLNKPGCAVVSASLAKKIFGEVNPVNRTIAVGSDSSLYTISGVMEDVPETSHFDADLIGSFMTNPISREGLWINNSFATYILLHKEATREAVEEKLPGMIGENIGPELQQLFGVSVEEFYEMGNSYKIGLLPLTDIHLDTRFGHGMKPTTDPQQLILFTGVALLIIIIAAINYMNLSTARAGKRAKEIGVKKVSGSGRKNLILQFVIESLLITFTALVLGILLVKLSLPWFNNLLNASFDLSLFSNAFTIPILLVFTIFVGILSASYPAFYLSSISPLSALMSQQTVKSGSNRLRHALVIFQFTASIGLIICTMVMFRQIKYMQNKDLGYNMEQLMVISGAGELDSRVDPFKESLKDIKGVIKVSAATAIPNHNNNISPYMMEGHSDESLLMQSCWVDYDHLDTWEIEMVEGRFFNRDFPSDTEGCILNESAVKTFGIENPLTACLLEPGGPGGNMNELPVIGIVKDFNFRSLRHEIEPLVMMYRTPAHQWGYVTLKLSPDNITGTIKSVEKVWKEFTSSNSMPWFFADNDFDRIYRQDRQRARLTIFFAIFAIFVAAMGLSGLTSFILSQRKKEIGIRKALGGSVSSVFTTIARDILILVFIAGLIAVPLSYYFSNNWLKNYFYRINISVIEFVLGILAAVIIALATISFSTLRAARTNPALSLRQD